MSKKAHRIEIVVDDYERTEFSRAAKARGMTVSAWIRFACRNWMLRERAVPGAAQPTMSDEEARKLSTFDAQVRK